MIPSHALDLPNLIEKPTKKALFEALENLKLPKLQNFEDNAIFPIPGLFDWLTGLISSDLSWINDGETKDLILDLASKRMSERCGRTAAPTRIREMKIGSGGSSLTVNLVEPTLTSDSLGLKTWGSSYILAKRLMRDHTEIFKQDNEQDILELGSGTGLCAIVLGKLDYRVIATDLKEITGNLQNNVDLNNVGNCVSVAVLDWSNPENFEYSDRRFKFIVVSDPIYSPDHPEMVVRTIRRYRTDSTIVYVQLPLRNKYEHERQSFYDLMQKCDMIQESYEEEEGQDDFGAQKYAWSRWRSISID